MTIKETKAELRSMCEDLGIEVPLNATKSVIYNLLDAAMPYTGQAEAEQERQMKSANPNKSKSKKQKTNDLQKFARQCIREAVSGGITINLHFHF